jgi:hypothetical protein
MHTEALMTWFWRPGYCTEVFHNPGLIVTAGMLYISSCHIHIILGLQQADMSVYIHSGWEGAESVG